MDSTCVAYDHNARFIANRKGTSLLHGKVLRTVESFEYSRVLRDLRGTICSRYNMRVDGS